MSIPDKEAQTMLAEVPKKLATSATASVFSNMQAFSDAQRMAQLLASCDMVPKAYVGNVANCTVAIEMAQRMGASPLAVMQNLHVIQGRPSWAAVFIIASLNTSGKFSPLRYKYTRDDKGAVTSCYAWAKDLSDGERLEGPAVTMKMALDEGWVQKTGSKWKTMPEVMFMYRAASFFGKLYSPELLMGMSSAEEAHDIIELEPNAQGEYVAPIKGNDGVKAKLKNNAVHPSEAHVIPAAEHVDIDTGEIIQQENIPAGKQTADDNSANDKLKQKLKSKTSNPKNASPDQF